MPSRTKKIWKIYGQTISSKDSEATVKSENNIELNNPTPKTRKFITNGELIQIEKMIHDSSYLLKDLSQTELCVEIQKLDVLDFCHNEGDNNLENKIEDATPSEIVLTSLQISEEA